MKSGWAYLNEGIGETISPAFSTAKGLDFTRSIEFRAVRGVIAQRCVDGRNEGAPASFYFANQYRVTSCMKSKIACQKSGWLPYKDGERPLLKNDYAYPNKAVAFDPYYNLYRTWDLKF